MFNLSLHKMKRKLDMNLKEQTIPEYARLMTADYPEIKIDSRTKDYSEYTLNYAND